MIPLTKAEKSRMRLFKIAVANPQSIPTILDAIKSMADEALKGTLDVAQRQAFQKLSESIVLLERQYKRQLEAILKSVDKTIEEKVMAVKPPKGEPGEKGDMWSKDEVLSLIMEVMPHVEDGKTPTKEELAAVAKPLLLELLTQDLVINRVIEERDKEVNDNLWGKMQKLIYDEINKVKKFSGGGYAGDRVKAGSGVSISQNSIGQKVISVTAGGANIETPTGDVDGVNDTFTVTATPAWIVADGITYYEDAGYTRSGTTITMDIPPSQYIRAIL